MRARADLSETPRVVADRYELHDVLGRGGMGIVWRGHDRLLDRTVAIKEVVPPPTLFGDDRTAVKARVLREARAAARLGHPGVVTVFDLVESEDRIFIVMEFVPGPSLEELVNREGPLSPAVAADVGAQVQEVLAVAHADGIVHRDVKPGNVLIVQGGRVKLGDFGIASIAGDPRITATGMVLGSPSYMAPEQARGEPVGPPTDLWGLGASLYFAVEGHPPFRKEQPIPTLAAVMQEEPLPPERAGPLGPLILDLLAKEPGARPSGRVLREMLLQIKSTAALGEETTEQLARIAASHPKTPVIPADNTLAVMGLAQPTPAPLETKPVEPEPLPEPAPPPPEPEPAPVQPEPEEPEPDPFEPQPEPVEPELSDEPVKPEDAEPIAEDRPEERLWPWGSAEEENVAQEPEQRPPRPPQKRWPAVLVGALVGVVILWLLGISVLTTGRSSTTGNPTTPAPNAARKSPQPAPVVPPPDEEQTSEPPTPSPSPEPKDEDEEGPSALSLPRGWTTFTEEETGYKVAYPKGWTIVHPGIENTTDFRDPGTGTYLRVAWRMPPGESAQGTWEEFSRTFADRHSGYEEIRIDRTTYKGSDNASEWEFRYTSGGATLHAIDLGVVRDGYGFALNFQTRESEWKRSLPTFERMKRLFVPPSK